MPRYSARIEAAVEVAIHDVVLWFSEKYSRPDVFKQRLRDGLNFSSLTANLENKIGLTDHLGLFSKELFQAMICGGSSYEPRVVGILWERMIEAGLLTEALPISQGIPLATHQIDELAMIQHLRDGTLVNIFRPPHKLAETYAQAVVAIDVEKDRDVFRGTGFVVESFGTTMLVTCKHNVDPDEGIVVGEITTVNGAKLSVGEFYISPDYDVACARVHSGSQSPTFALSEDVNVFDEVYTLGYPSIPHANPSLVGHRGELNARTTLYLNSCPILIISNLVSPGNSGGPVLTRDGRCVGMIVNWLEGEKADGERLERMRFSAALPSHVLQIAMTGMASAAAAVKPQPSPAQGS